VFACAWGAERRAGNLAFCDVAIAVEPGAPDSRLEYIKLGKGTNTEVQLTHRIQRVAVLGAGTMGAAIAAHPAHSGLEVDLLDIAPNELTEEEEQKGLTLESPEVRNRVVNAGFERMKNARPPALMSERVAERMRTGNFEDDLERVKDADWILEAIVEKLEPKQDLMARVEELARATPSSLRTPPASRCTVSPRAARIVSSSVSWGRISSTRRAI
jgi:hypothetical protein